LEEFSNPPIELPELVSSQIRSSTISYEGNRIKYAHKSDPLGLDDLTGWLKTLPGPRLLIVNTVQSAAVIADAIRNTEGKSYIEHLSTALCPRDRKTTLDRVKNRLAKQTDENWTLVATSCVEAGVDLSFQTGLRERCSFNSLIQTGGRINREGKYKDSTMWDFKLRHNSLLINHKAFETSSRILGELIAEQMIRPDLATEAMRREIRSDGLRQIGNEILSYERNLQFPQMAESFKVIDSETITVIVDENLKQKILKHEKIDFNEIQQLSVQIWFNKESKYDLQAIEGFPELRFWNLLYDDFLGYMAGVLPLLKQDQNGSSFG
jgi:CRISPR-associated endonuclease/helicase Cas3